MSKKTVVPVILCGGSGTRLWPASRENHPKQFLNLMDDFSLLQNTMRRALRLANVEAANLVTVTLGSLRDGVERQLSEMDEAGTYHILCEPSARNTAAAVAFAASYVERAFGGDAILWVLPADNHIGDENALAESLKHALEAAEKGYLVTFGINPTRPETGYGYIRLGNATENSAVYSVKSFVEKPDLETARQYVAEGTYLWNSGMFLFPAESVLAQYREHASEILDAVEKAMNSTADRREPDATLYNQIEEQPFDKAIMEKSAHVAVVPSNPSWSDIGSWESLWEISAKDAHGNVIKGRAAYHDTKNCLIHAENRLVACAGIEDMVIVETGDALLVMPKNGSDAMKTMVKALKKTGSREVLDPPAEPQPWSLSKPLEPKEGYDLREIVVRPGETLSLKMHAHSSKFWTVLQGIAVVTLAQEQNHITERQTMFIPAGVDYSLMNPSDVELKVVEVNHNDSKTVEFRPLTKNKAA